MKELGITLDSIDFVNLMISHYICSPLKRDVAQPGSAHVWGACGRWFESSRPDKQNPSAKLMDFVFKEFKTLTLV